MSEVVRVLFDGKVLLPEKPLKLIPHQTYTITIESDKTISDDEQGWDCIEKLIGTVEAPQDWALEHDHYLYGLPKRSNDNNDK
ncbi:MAG: hypothetical protein EWV53_17155 [Microcystis panniformis Mp_MB_F_20051200_S9]|uniref:DUF104 domain-containing protein n=1 Tax=Microcystis panniformis Mp_MB_F_20051200_S9 TaxID=2486223 RepID=A0A552PQV4_9CHRO|nr:MAG: hypothetical protein EWV87_20360 [Microcystis panniformis Mp_GB_SS_20050300_S99]TRV46230.1 MAG: hypothetical protein EWV42_18615 [Microcystis panniformis Mp_GB_SS_20050300_S99D]TRV52487.1 MAG: hypothetical protein EWV43_02125 [Microcystis panniformis Mp_MB_F_20080800_S26D]TRV58350.1 MAG: hypothetical protein EWV69_14090 [Microcystis panniformis Mp_MB_F_20080800_S26]TRV59276.1 MAG: hypothetical protein EWV53_17155 [Microcystis panniformis Mp_MB_F_20051200_S9]TRV61135.1 MAG: hypothetical